MLPDEELTSSCGAVTVIAKSGTDRFLARCTCGCLHLVWDNTSISLLEADLQRLLDHPPRDDQAVSRQFEMREDPFGGFQVWAGSGGLRIAGRDWGDLMTLLEHGVAQVAVKAGATGAASSAVRVTTTAATQMVAELPN